MQHAVVQLGLQAGVIESVPEPQAEEHPRERLSSVKLSQSLSALSQTSVAG